MCPSNLDNIFELDRLAKAKFKKKRFRYVENIGCNNNCIADHVSAVAYHNLDM